MTAKDGRAATVKVAFKTVTDRFVEQNAWPARAQYHWQRARRCCDRVQINHRHTDSLFCPCIRTHVAVFVSQAPLVAKTSTAAAGATLTFAVIFHLNAHRQTNQRAHICRQRTVRCRNQNQFVYTR
ncbi:hypothetical protein D3C86_1326800 [compost metagenome]